jgi:nicotinic acetylcholine receptor, invertebrate
MPLYVCSAGDKFNDYMVTNAIVSPDGTVLWLFPALIKTYCTLNVKYFPFDTQNCEIIFISWTHSGEQLDIFYNDSMTNSVYYVSTNQVCQRTVLHAFPVTQ